MFPQKGVMERKEKVVFKTLIIEVQIWIGSLFNMLAIFFCFLFFYAATLTNLKFSTIDPIYTINCSHTYNLIRLLLTNWGHLAAVSFWSHLYDLDLVLARKTSYPSIFWHWDQYLTRTIINQQTQELQHSGEQKTNQDIKSKSSYGNNRSLNSRRFVWVWEWICLDSSFPAGRTRELTFSLLSTEAELVAENNNNTFCLSVCVCVNIIRSVYACDLYYYNCLHNTKKQEKILFWR